jgi:hypothetical protein
MPAVKAYLWWIGMVRRSGNFFNGCQSPHHPPHILSSPMPHTVHPLLSRPHPIFTPEVRLFLLGLADAWVSSTPPTKQEQERMKLDIANWLFCYHLDLFNYVLWVEVKKVCVFIS